MIAGLITFFSRTGKGCAVAARASKRVGRSKRDCDLCAAPGELDAQRVKPARKRRSTAVVLGHGSTTTNLCSIETGERWRYYTYIHIQRSVTQLLAAVPPPVALEPRGRSRGSALASCHHNHVIKTQPSVVSRKSRVRSTYPEALISDFKIEPPLKL